MLSYDSEDGFGGLLLGNLSKTKTVSEGVKTAFTEISVETLKTSENLSGLASHYSITNNSALEFMKSVNKGTFSLKDGENALQGYQRYLDKVPQGLDLATIKTKALSASMKILSSIGWMIAITLATEIISGFVDMVDKAITTLDEAREKSDNFKKSISDFNSSVSKGKSELASIADRYDELSKGVSSLGQNISLTSEEYDEYKDLVSQVSDIMPELSTLYDNQGNKIKIIGENLATVNEEYEKYIQNQARDLLYNGNEETGSASDTIEFINKDNNVGLNGLDGILKNLNSWDGFWGDLNLDNFSTSDIYQELMEIRDMSQEEMAKYFDKSWSGYAPNSYTLGMDEALRREALAQILGIDFEVGIGGGSGDKVRDMDKGEFDTFLNKIQAQIKSQENSIDNNRQSINDIAQLYAEGTDEYFELLNQDERGLLSTVINSFMNDETIDEYFKENGEYTEGKIYPFVDNLIQTISDESTGVSEAFSNLINFDKNTADMSFEEIQEYYKEQMDIIATQLGFTEDQISNMFNLDTLDQINNKSAKYAETMRKAYAKFGADQYDDKGFATGDTKLDNFAKENSINTEEERAFWDKCIEESNTREEAMKKYLNLTSSKNKLTLVKRL